MKRITFKPCDCCAGCELHYSDDDLQSFIALGKHIDAAPKAVLEAVPLRKADPGHSFALRRDGSVEEVAEEPCSEWRRRIKSAYRAGYRAVRFDEVLSSNDGATK